MGNSSNFREVYVHESQLALDHGDMSTGIVRDSRRVNGGLDLEFDQLEQGASQIDIIEEIRRESKIIKL